ncbi:uncharacterized protein BCR38DRAFT_411303 [Pseudomassariella vexata]|uniref:DUF8035 domain-containing protein n=1 Tax=Pseudomassariella vexata TaxID=1141098 RepID=A0A1Y2DQF9_9PEZI|nr:uncharacterized protein BCR38DRAFT_411303 [Pseudomassariella vexata]ORY61429.1 hypothetical protein BCR38DRAFT_411303 [Pseudomassariella vexata]
MAYRASTGRLASPERWNRERFIAAGNTNGNGNGNGNMFSGSNRFEEDDQFYSRGPPRRAREPSVDSRYERRASRPYDGDYVRDERYYDDEPRYRRSPPPEMERKVVVDRTREYRSPSPLRRPAPLLRRQSSLDTFDRRPAPKFLDREEAYGPPARRSDYRPEPYQPIPLPRNRALPPPRIYAERDEREFDEIRISEPDRYGDDDFHAYPERIREREVTRTRRRRDPSSSRTSRSRAHTRHGSSVRSSSKSSVTTSTSSASSSVGTTVTVKSEYPKKGKTRIPGRLVSKRALIDLGYPFIEEGTIIVVQKALGQDNIDDLLKLSEDYKKAELEVVAARSEPGNIVEERRTEIITVPPPPPPPAPVAAPPPPQPTLIHTHAPPPPPPPQQYVEQTTIVRDVSPARSQTSYTTSTTATPYFVEARPREYSEEIPVGPMALVADRRRGDRDIQAEIARLEAERDLIRRERHHHHHSHSHSPSGELVRAERLPTGELVLYEEEIIKEEEARRGVRLEKKRGRMQISVPKAKK